MLLLPFVLHTCVPNLPTFLIHCIYFFQAVISAEADAILRRYRAEGLISIGKKESTRLDAAAAESGLSLEVVMVSFHIT